MIEVNHLTKRYGKNTAVSDISFKVGAGEILGFLGPNGAGKSTTMNIITGYISATEGEVKIGGFDILKQPQEAKKRIGYLPEIPPVYIDMTVTEYLDFAADLKQVPKSQKKQMISDIMEKIKISHVSGKLIKNLSKGYRQRVGLAQSMIGYPDVLVLDEPTVGLDPKQIMEIRDVIKDLGKEHTIILSSHILSEVSAICDRVMILSHGNIVASDTPDRLSSKLSMGSRYRIRLRGDESKISQALSQNSAISHLERCASEEENTFDFIIEGAEGCDPREAVFHTAAENGFVLLLIKSEKMSLEEVFLKVTEEDMHAPISEKDSPIQTEPVENTPDYQAEKENVFSDAGSPFFSASPLSGQEETPSDGVLSEDTQINEKKEADANDSNL